MYGMGQDVETTLNEMLNELNITLRIYKSHKNYDSQTKSIHTVSNL